jgi:hypothetical protein
MAVIADLSWGLFDTVVLHVRDRDRYRMIADVLGTN